MYSEKILLGKKHLENWFIKINFYNLLIYNQLDLYSI